LGMPIGKLLSLLIGYELLYFNYSCTLHINNFVIVIVIDSSPGCITKFVPDWSKLQVAFIFRSIQTHSDFFFSFFFLL